MCALSPVSGPLFPLRALLIQIPHRDRPGATYSCLFHGLPKILRASFNQPKLALPEAVRPRLLAFCPQVCR